MSEKERLQGYLDKIHEIRQNKLMTYDVLVKKLIHINDRIDEVREEFLKIPSENKTAIFKYTGIIKSFSNQKSVLTALRQVLKDLHTEEARFEKELIKLQAIE